MRKEKSIRLLTLGGSNAAFFYGTALTDFLTASIHRLYNDTLNYMCQYIINEGIAGTGPTMTNFNFFAEYSYLLRSSMHRSLLYNRQASWQHRPHRRKLLRGKKGRQQQYSQIIVFIRSCSIHIYTCLHTSYIHTIHIIYRKTDTQAFINILYSFIHTYIQYIHTYIHTCIHRQISWITSNRFDTTVRDVTLTEGTTITNGFYVVWSVLT